MPDRGGKGRLTDPVASSSPKFSGDLWSAGREGRGGRALHRGPEREGHESARTVADFTHLRPWPARARPEERRPPDCLRPGGGGGDCWTEGVSPLSPHSRATFPARNCAGGNKRPWPGIDAPGPGWWRSPLGQAVSTSFLRRPPTSSAGGWKTPPSVGCPKACRAWSAGPPAGPGKGGKRCPRQSIGSPLDLLPREAGGLFLHRPADLLFRFARCWADGRPVSTASGSSSPRGWSCYASNHVGELFRGPGPGRSPREGASELNSPEVVVPDPVQTRGRFGSAGASFGSGLGTGRFRHATPSVDPKRSHRPPVLRIQTSGRDKKSNTGNLRRTGRDGIEASTDSAPGFRTVVRGGAPGPGRRSGTGPCTARLRGAAQPATGEKPWQGVVIPRSPDCAGTPPDPSAAGPGSCRPGGEGESPTNSADAFAGRDPSLDATNFRSSAGPRPLVQEFGVLRTIARGSRISKVMNPIDRSPGLLGTAQPRSRGRRL